MENLKRLRIYLHIHRPSIVLGAICAILSGLISVSLVYSIERVLQPILKANLDVDTRMQRLNVLVVVLASLALLRVFVDFGQVYIIQRTSQRIFTKLREDLFKHFQNLPVGFFEGHRTGEVISRLTNDLTALTTLANLGITVAVGAPIEIIGMLGYMLHSNWKLTLFIFVVLPPMAILINRAGRRIRRATAEVQAQAANLTEYLQEKFAAMRLIQTFGTRDYEIELFDKVNQDAYRATMKPIRIHATLAPMIDFIGLMSVLLALWFGAKAIQKPEDVAPLITFLLALHRVATRAKSLASLNLILKQADAAAARIWEVLDTEPHIRNAPNAVTLNGISGHLKLEDVRFAYGEKGDEGADVLHGISLELKPGQMIALAGESGSGKSTIAALVPRLYDPSSGRVTIDGHDLRDVTLESLRSNIGAVPQETTLFHGSIRDNIAYGRPDATFEEIVEAAKKANADEFIRAQPKGYDTPIGERGNKLSGGQRQRLAIARALLRNPKVLILDEATASLDSKTEAAVQDALNTLMAGRTTLVIAHRFSTIQNADRIYVLDKGRVIECGKHQELLDKRGVYFNLYQAQNFAKETIEA